MGPNCAKSIRLPNDSRLKGLEKTKLWSSIFKLIVYFAIHTAHPVYAVPSACPHHTRNPHCSWIIVRFGVGCHHLVGDHQVPGTSAFCGQSYRHSSPK